MTHDDRWTVRLSDYIDEELTPPECAEIEAHLAGCAACRATLAELRAVVARAAAATDAAPAEALWPGIAARLSHPLRVRPIGSAPARRFSFTMPQLVAAGLALMVVSGGGAWVLEHGGRATSLQSIAASSSDRPVAVTPVSLGDPRYDDAVADLQQTLDDNGAQLDPQTIAILKANLAAIDRAIDQSRQALAADPANVYLHNHLAEARQHKLALLRQATALVNKG